MIALQSRSAGVLHSRWIGRLWSIGLVAMSTPGPLQAQTPAASFQAQATALQNTSLQAVFAQVVRDTRTRTLNTVATVTWPILPQEEGLSLRLRKLDTIRIPNQAFIQYNRDFSTDLIKFNDGAAQVYRLLNRANEEEPKIEDAYLRELIKSGMGVDLDEAAAVALDRQRVLEILKNYGGARLSIEINNRQPQTVLTDLTWEFTPYQGSLPNGNVYYRFAVRIVAENVGIVLDPKDGVQQTLRLSETLLPDPNLPPVRLKDSTVVQTQKLKSEALAEQAGAGQANPLLLLVNLTAPQLSEQVTTGVLNSQRLSLITGLLVSGAGGQSLTGVNVYLNEGTDPTANLGITAGIGPNSSLYAGPSVSLGNNTFVLSAGALFAGNQGEGTRLAGVASVDLSRLLLGKPDPAQSARQIDVAPQQVTGLFTSAELLKGTRLVVLKVNPALRAQLQSPSLPRDVKINSQDSGQSVPTTIDTEGYIFFRSENAVDTYAVRFCEQRDPRNCIAARPIALTPENRNQVLTLLPANPVSSGPISVEEIPVMPSPTPAPSASTFRVVNIEPANGVAGRGFVTITTTGEGLVRGARVLFNGTPALRVSILRRTQLTADIPASAQSGPIDVILPSGKKARTRSFEVVGSSPAEALMPPNGPKIVSLNPARGVAGGTVVTITIEGENLRRGTQVFFNGSPAASVNIIRRNQLTADVPPDAQSGALEVVLPSGRRIRSAVNFIVER